jgi:hypothetical protein
MDYDPRESEFKDYLNSLYGNHEYPEALSYEKVFKKNIFYQAYCEQKNVVDAG